MATLRLEARARANEQATEGESAVISFLTEKAREHHRIQGQWPTVKESLETAAVTSKRGEWQAPQKSENWETDPRGYFRGYITWALQPEHHVFEYVSGDAGSGVEAAGMEIQFMLK